MHSLFVLVCRDICKDVGKKCAAVRILTLGIGPYCNSFFLKMLSLLSRGFSDVAVYPDKSKDICLHIFLCLSN